MHEGRAGAAFITAHVHVGPTVAALHDLTFSSVIVMKLLLHACTPLGCGQRFVTKRAFKCTIARPLEGTKTSVLATSLCEVYG